jgi:hypothetical protein
MKTKVKIHLEDGEIEMQCEVMPMEKPFVNLKEILPNIIETVLFEKKHANLQTQFELTSLESCWILIFDENKEFVTVKPHFYKGNAPFSIFVPEPYILILHSNQKLKFENILSISTIGEEGGDYELL